MSQKFQGGRQAKYHGLMNQGATCYLNSVLQVLFMTKNFRERITRQSHIKNDAKKDHIETELSDLFSALEKRQADTRSITKKLKINNVFEQRDAAEHYEKILRNISPEASQMFHGQLTNRNTCNECKTITKSKTGFWSLPLPLVNDNNEYSVEKGIKDFFRPSEISGDDQMYCEKCDKKCDAVLDCEVKHCPEVLVLLLKRFELTCVGNVWENVKINCPVKMPDTLQIKQDKIYKLYAFVEHFGSLRYGHYIATIKSQDDGLWYIFDDLNVQKSSYHHFQLDPTETSESVYLLFYQKDTNVDRHDTPDTLPTTTLLNGTEDHHSSKEEAVNITFYTNDQPVTPVSKRNMREDRPDEQNEPKRRKTNEKYELGPEKCSERSQVLENRHKETGQIFDPGKHGEPNVKGSYRNSRDVNEKPKMQSKHNEGEDQAMAKTQQPEYLLDKCILEKARWDTQHVSQQDSGYQNFDSVRQSKHKEPNVKASYGDSRVINETAKIYNKRNEGKDQAMAEMQQSRQQHEYSPQKARLDTHVRGSPECRQQNGLSYKDRDSQTRQVNRSNSCVLNQNGTQWELTKIHQSKQMESSSRDYNTQSDNIWGNLNVGQQRIRTALHTQDVKSYEKRPCRQVKRSKSCAPTQNRALQNVNWPIVNNHGNPKERIGGSSFRNETDQMMRHSFHESNRPYCSQDIQLENFGKEIQNNKMSNEGLKKNSRRDEQNDNKGYEKRLTKDVVPKTQGRQKSQPISPQQCLDRCESHYSSRQNLQTGHLQRSKGTCDDDMSKMNDRNQLCHNIKTPEAESTPEEVKRSDPLKKTKELQKLIQVEGGEGLEANNQSRKMKKDQNCLRRFCAFWRYFSCVPCRRKRTK